MEEKIATCLMGKAQNNLVHGSDSPENAKLEIDLWFGPGELVSYQPTDQAWIG